MEVASENYEKDQPEREETEEGQDYRHSEVKEEGAASQRDKPSLAAFEVNKD